MKILICNAGSTSLKFKLFDMPAETVEAVCHIERVGADHDSMIFYKNLLNGEAVKQEKIDIPDYRQGIVLFLDYLTKGETAVLDNVRQIERVGFKVTLSKNHHGVFELTDEVLRGMEEWISLAPVHNRAYLNAVDVLRKLLP
ncbi:MAG: acetate kinase, partial [Clostridia bacterium]|nr:acetate kinase [Clostridia bacterium]